MLGLDILVCLFIKGGRWLVTCILYLECNSLLLLSSLKWNIYLSNRFI